MINRFKKTEPQIDALQIAIDNLYAELAGYEAHTKEYAAIADQIVKLEKFKKEQNPSWRPSPDAVIGAVASLGGILVILNFERAGVVTTKALNFVRQMKS